MLCIPLPDHEPLTLDHLVCDLNGTLAEDGLLLDGVTERMVKVARLLTVHILSADTNGTLDLIAEHLRQAAVAADVAAPSVRKASSGADKVRYVSQLAATRVVAMGNGANDEAMLRAAAVSIGVIGREGACLRGLLAADIVVLSPLDGLDLLLHPDRLVATLRP